MIKGHQRIKALIIRIRDYNKIYITREFREKDPHQICGKLLTNPNGLFKELMK